MTEITDEMVERACNAYSSGARPKWMREALKAALNPPKPEPEIEVSAAMVEAGIQASIDWWAGKIDGSRVAAMFRAMESTRRKEAEITQQWKFAPQEGAAYAAKDARQGVNDAGPVKETGGGVWYTHRHRRSTDQGTWCTHCREDDPK